MPASNDSDLLDMSWQMVLMRIAEDTLLRLFEAKEMPGFILSCIGDEATAVGVCHALQTTDIVSSTRRSHGHNIARGGDLDDFFAELDGWATGTCNGKGGSMHVADLDIVIFGANGIVGGGVPIAAGTALASSIQKTDRVSVAFMGDGATDIGLFHETLNLAGVWNPPVVLVAENNGFADFIRVSDHQTIDNISERGAACEMPGVAVDRNDVEAVNDAARGAVARARRGDGSTLPECVSYRWRGHFEDDPQPCRSQVDVVAWKARDPLLAAEARLEALGLVDADTFADIRARAAVIAEDALDELDRPVRRVCGLDTPIPVAPQMESYVLPTVDRIVTEVR